MTQAEIDAAKQEEFDDLVRRVNSQAIAQASLHENVHELEDRVAALEAGAGTTGKK